MTPHITLQPISVMADGGPHEGRLVLADNQLVAVLCRVTAEETLGEAKRGGGWFLEAGFGSCGPLMSVTPPTFPDLEAAIGWVRTRVEAGFAPS